MTEFLLQIESTFVGRLLFVIALFAVGLGITSIFSKSPKPMGRFMFGLIYLFGTSIGISAPYLWAFVAPDGVDAASIAYVGIILSYMTLVAYAARCRSIDAYGHSGNAYFVIIPIANLFLIFKGPSGPRTAERSLLTLVGRFILFVPLAFAAIVPGVFLKVLGEQNLKPPYTANLSVQRAVAIQELLVKASAPLYLDAQTALTGANSSETQLTFEYMVFKKEGQASIDSTILKIAMEPYVATVVCSDQNLKHIVRGGIPVTFSYSLIETGDEFSITINECNS